MRYAVLLGSMVVATAAAFACSETPSVDQQAPVPTDDSGTTTPPSSTPDADTPSGPAGTGLNTGLPCDVQTVTENRCIACHDGKTAVALLKYDDFLKKSTVDPTKTLAEMSLIRMKSTTSPMPPPPAAPPEADEIQVFEDWVKAGTPKGAVCTTPPPPSTTDGGTDAGAIVGDGGLVCTSGTTWTGGNSASPLMNPGEACLACHQVMGGPNLRIAGTVYPTAHEPDKCNGSKPPPQLTVVITDKNNKVINIPVSNVGNFDTRTRYTPPYKAAVTDGTKTRAMVGTVTSGDCNSCHTVLGANGAPGRIMAP